MKVIFRNCVSKESFENLITKLHYVGLFRCVNDNKEVDGKTPQIMYCMFCYNGLNSLCI
jgi:hypothetical protein